MKRKREIFSWEERKMRKYIFLAGALALLLAGCGTSAPDQTEALTSIAA
jgi:prokaryotic membrane lipoprotein lipid attachment site